MVVELIRTLAYTKKGVSKLLGVVYLKCDPAERHGHRDDQRVVEPPVHLQLRRHLSRLQKMDLQC